MFSYQNVVFLKGKKKKEREKALYSQAVLEIVIPIPTSAFKVYGKMEYRGWQKRFTSSNRKVNEAVQEKQGNFHWLITIA